MPFNFDSNPLSFDRSDSPSETSLLKNLHLYVVHCYLDALGRAGREPVQMVETQSRVLSARRAKKQERQQRRRAAC